MERRKWTKEEDDLLRERYPDTFAKDIAALLNRSISSVHTRVGKLGIKSSKEKISRAGRIGSEHPNMVACRFKKGSIPANKGKKMSAEMYERCKGTMFKKGQLSHNRRPLGSERVNMDGYVEIKVAEPNKWRLKHRVLWEEAHGPIPKGHNIQFKDGNKQNLAMDNLYMISQADQLKFENSIHARYPEELKKVIMLKAAIKKQITDQTKKKHERN